MTSIKIYNIVMSNQVDTLIEIKGKHEIQKCSSRLNLRVGRNYNEEISSAALSSCGSWCNV